MKHTVSLELSKLLKEKGFPQQTLLIWSEAEYGEPFVLLRSLSVDKPEFIICSAPLLSEVLEQLPIDKTSLNNYAGVWDCEFCHNNELLYTSDNNPCDAAAKLWLQLKEEGII